MLWSLSEGKIIEDPEGVSWTEAVKHQRAFLANESRVASMYTELDAVTEEHAEEVEPATEQVQLQHSPLSPFAAELVGLLLKDDRERSLTASIAQSQESIAEHLRQTQEERQALVAALATIGNPTINVSPADVQVDVNVPPAEVRVEAAQIHLPAPEVVVQAAAAPNVTVNPEIILPSPSKTITFERDFDGRVTKADVTEQ